MKKLLFVIPTLGSGGAEKSLVNLLCELPLDSYDISVMVFANKGLFIDQVPSKVNIITPQPDLYYLYNKPDIKVLRSAQGLAATVCRLIGTVITRSTNRNVGRANQIRWNKYYSKFLPENNQDYDVAIAYLEGEAMYYVADKVKAKRKIAWFHNDYKSKMFDPRFDQVMFKRFDTIVTISDECKSILCDTFPMMQNKFIVIPNLVSESRIRALGEAETPDMVIPSGWKTIVSVGRLNKQKGFDLAVSAAKLLKEREYKFVWYIIGEGEERATLEKQILDLGLNAYVKLIGCRINPYAYMRKADIFAQTSRFEGKSIVLDEAKILGKAILTTAYPTVKDQIKEHEGLIVDINSNAIAKGLEQMLSDEDLRFRLSTQLLSEHYGNIELIEKYRLLFN